MIGFERTAVSVPGFVHVEPYMISLDADVNRAGEFVFVTRDVHGLSVHIPHRDTTQRLSFFARFPQIRWIGPSRALLFDLRSDIAQANAWVIDDEGAICASFAIGDGVADVLATGSQIIVTYFDEGVFGDDPLGQDGIVAFTSSGEFRWGWNTSVLADRLTVYDCYAAGLAHNDATLGALLYSQSEVSQSYAFALLDVEARTAELHAVPDRLYRTQALSAAHDGKWLFAVRRGDEQHVVAWYPGDAGYATAPSPIHLTRGLGGGRFMSITEASVEVVTVTITPPNN